MKFGNKLLVDDHCFFQLLVSYFSTELLAERDCSSVDFLSTIDAHAVTLFQSEVCTNVSTNWCETGSSLQSVFRCKTIWFVGKDGLLSLSLCDIFGLI